MPPRRPRPSADQQPLDMFPETLQREKGHYLVGPMLACNDEEFMKRRQEQLVMSDALDMDKLVQQDFVKTGFQKGNYEIWQRQTECESPGQAPAIALVGLAWAVHNVIEKELPPTTSTKRGRDGVFGIAKKIDKTVDARDYADAMSDSSMIDKQLEVIKSFGYDCREGSVQAFMEGVLSFTPARLVGNFLRAYRDSQQEAVITGSHNVVAQKHVWRCPNPSTSLEIPA